MKNLKFPEISKEIQQSIFGAWEAGNLMIQPITEENLTK